MEPSTLQILLILGPIAISAVLGPILIAILGRAKSKAEAENFETQSDKTRFEAMDVLVNRMREEVNLSKADITAERLCTRECRVERDALEQQLGSCERGAAESLRWGIALYEQVRHQNITPAHPPGRVLNLIDDLDIDSQRILPKRVQATLQEINDAKTTKDRPSGPSST